MGKWLLSAPRAAIPGAAFVCGPVSSLAGSRKTNTLLPLNSEEGDNKGKASLASRNSLCDPWMRGSSTGGWISQQNRPTGSGQKETQDIHLNKG